MAKTITLEHEGAVYTLEYTRNSIEIMEKRGFKIADIADKPMTTLPSLFAGAFLEHHKSVKKSVVDKIFESLGDKTILIEKLAEMYNEPLEALLDEPKEKNLKWEANW